MVNICNNKLFLQHYNFEMASCLHLMTFYEFIINFLTILFTFLLLEIDSEQKSIPVNFHKNQ